jgi:membrane associated rhomboid family serine protease
VLYPGVRIRIHRLVGFVSITWRLPVWFYVGIWFLGLQLLGIALRVPGVGWHAHLGGFLFGLLVMFFLRKSNLL